MTNPTPQRETIELIQHGAFHHTRNISFALTEINQHINEQEGHTTNDIPPYTPTPLTPTTLTTDDIHTLLEDNINSIVDEVCLPHDQRIAPHYDEDDFKHMWVEEDLATMPWLKHTSISTQDAYSLSAYQYIEEEAPLYIADLSGQLGELLHQYGWTRENLDYITAGEHDAYNNWVLFAVEEGDVLGSLFNSKMEVDNFTQYVREHYMIGGDEHYTYAFDNDDKLTQSFVQAYASLHNIPLDTRMVEIIANSVDNVEYTYLDNIESTVAAKKLGISLTPTFSENVELFKTTGMLIFNRRFYSPAKVIRISLN